jgi:hypothetical protein
MLASRIKGGCALHLRAARDGALRFRRADHAVFAEPLHQGAPVQRADMAFFRMRVTVGLGMGHGGGSVHGSHCTPSRGRKIIRRLRRFPQIKDKVFAQDFEIDLHRHPCAPYKDINS